MNKAEYLRAISEMAEQVWDFHERWGFWPFAGAERPAGQAVSERQAILDEEVRELREAIEEGDEDEIAGEAADVLFVAMGHVLSLRERGVAGVISVTSKNARKTEKTHRVRPDTGKLLPIRGKPHKWD